MRDFEQLKNILDEQKVVKEDQQLVRDFLISFDFQKRQQMIGIFMGRIFCTAYHIGQMAIN